MVIGVLALQGAVSPHLRKLGALGLQGVPVRSAAELGGCAGLIIPGGESTTFLVLMREYGLMGAIREFGRSHPVWGVCAGSIIIAAAVENPSQESIGLMPMRVRRNAYGRQNESFIANFEVVLPGGTRFPQEGVFIRAPLVVDCGDGVEILARHQGWPVALQYGRHLATTFHPELAPGEELHRHFAELCLEACGEEQVVGAARAV